MKKYKVIRVVASIILVLVLNRLIRSGLNGRYESPETAAVQQQVEEQVPCHSAKANLIQGNGLFVDVVNPPWDGLSADDLKEKMRQAALAAYQAYPMRDQLRMVDINYFTETDIFIIPPFRKFVTSASFGQKDLQPVDPLATPGPDATPTPGS